jgi:hypothetical protein
MTGTASAAVRSPVASASKGNHFDRIDPEDLMRQPAQHRMVPSASHTLDASRDRLATGSRQSKVATKKLIPMKKHWSGVVLIGDTNSRNGRRMSHTSRAGV